MNIVLLFSILILSLILNYLLIKKKLFLNFRGDKHQKFTSSGNIPLSGGLILIFTSYYYLDILNFIFVSVTVMEEKYTAMKTIKV